MRCQWRDDASSIHSASVVWPLTAEFECFTWAHIGCMANLSGINTWDFITWPFDRRTHPFKRRCDAIVWLIHKMYSLYGWPTVSNYCPVPGMQKVRPKAKQRTFSLKPSPAMPRQSSYGHLSRRKVYITWQPIQAWSLWRKLSHDASCFHWASVFWPLTAGFDCASEFLCDDISVECQLLRLHNSAIWWENLSDQTPVCYNCMTDPQNL
jgi:hypothetical protein